MLPDYIENHYTTAFRLLGVDSNDPLLLSGWYCIAQWIERYVAANRPVSDKDILLLLQSNFDLQKTSGFANWTRFQLHLRHLDLFI